MSREVDGAGWGDGLCICLHRETIPTGTLLSLSVLMHYTLLKMLSPL